MRDLPLCICKPITQVFGTLVHFDELGFVQNVILLQSRICIRHWVSTSRNINALVVLTYTVE
jgi:hypothetical protein